RQHTGTTFTPVGMLETTSVRGKANTEGDQSRPGVRMEYDFFPFADSPPTQRRPIFVRALRHMHHDTETDILLPDRDETIETREYSDGFGRLLQTRTQAEEARFGDDTFAGAGGVRPAAESEGA